MTSPIDAAGRRYRNQRAALDAASGLSAENPVASLLDVADPPSVNTPTDDEKAALDAANAPDGMNPFATMADVGGVSDPLVIGAVEASDYVSVDGIHLAPIQVAEVPLTDTDIKNLGLQVPFDVVDAPVSGKYLNFIQAIVLIDASDTPYGGIDAAASLSITYGDQTSASTFMDSATLGAVLGGDSELAVATFIPASVISGGQVVANYNDRSQLENKPLSLTAWNNNAGAFSGGAVANSGKVKVWYTVENF